MIFFRFSFSSSSSPGVGGLPSPRSCKTTVDVYGAFELIVSYSAAEKARSAGEYRPHGANVTEDPHLSGKREFGAVGTEKDPARAAELEFAKRDALPGGAAVSGKDFGGVDGGSKFSGLGDERA